MSEQYNTIPVGVPRTFINGTVFIGFDESSGELEYKRGYQAYYGYKNQIQEAIIKHLAAQNLIEENLRKGKHEIQHLVERLIRAYDPCFSCASHFLRINWI